jgi:hypothetical protein
MAVSMLHRPIPEDPKTLTLDDSDGKARKRSLISGELADLEAIRNDGSSINNKSTIRFARDNCWDNWLYNLKIARQKPRIVIISFLVFVILCGGGLGLVFFFANTQDGDEKASALNLAVETGRWFCKSHVKNHLYDNTCRYAHQFHTNIITDYIVSLSSPTISRSTRSSNPSIVFIGTVRR